MKKTIEVVVSPTGDVSIEAVGFKGSDCESATAYLEEALGMVGKKNRKREYWQKNVSRGQQKVGQ